MSWVIRNPVEFYPNPAGKELFLQVQDLSEIESVVLYNSIGKEWRPVIQNEGANGLKKLILPDVAPGMYSIKIQFVDGAETRKVIIEQ